MYEHKIQNMEAQSFKHVPIYNVNEKHKQQFSKLEHLALWITNHVGSMGFFILVFLWTISWLGWNTLAPKQWRFDTFPAFALWLFISNLIQLFLLPLVMIGQNLQTKHSELRAEQDFRINKKAELEIKTIIENMETQTKLLQKIIKKIDKK